MRLDADRWSPIHTTESSSVDSVKSKIDQDAAIWIADYSLQPRFGCKGRGAADWLENQGLTVPANSNSWVMTAETTILRLGNSEFLIESTADVVNKAKSLPREASVYPVLRQDCAFELGGTQVDKLLRQICSLHFEALNLTAQPIILTAMIGVSVIILPKQEQAHTHFRIWADNTYGFYLWNTLLGIGNELGGSRICSGRDCACQ
jgi:sarcosine oxidase subunit gamma